MTTDLFIPTIWSNRILQRLKIALAYASPYCVNHDYEGDIAQYGDTVKIHGISDPTISDYTKNTDMSAPEVLDDFEQTLTIDQAKSYHFYVDDIDRKQAQPNFRNEAMDRAGYGLALKADQYVAGLMVAAAGAASVSGEPSSVDIGTAVAPAPIAMSDTSASEAAYEFLVDLGVALDEQKIPRSPSRFAIVPPWFVGMLSKDIRFVGYGGAAGNTVLTDGFAGQADQNGLAGRAAGFNVITSLNVPSFSFTGSSSYKHTTSGALGHTIVAGTPDATSFANQIVETEAFRSQARFGDVLRGLHVYGSKVVWPERLQAAYVAPGA